MRDNNLFDANRYFWNVMKKEKGKDIKIERPYSKKLDAKKFLGLIKWDEEPVAFQRRLRGKTN